MAYTIHKADGTVVTIADNSLDVAYYNPTGGSTSLGQGTYLVGRNTIDYGAAIAQNFLQLTENFSSSAFPSDNTALQGQLWFNKTSGTTGNLYVRVSGATSGGLANWQKVVSVSSSETGTTPVINPSGTPKDGDMQVVGSVISLWAGGAWRQIFPAIYS